MEKAVKIDESLLKKVQNYRKKNGLNKVKYPSDKHFINMAVMKLLKEEGENLDKFSK